MKTSKETMKNHIWGARASRAPEMWVFGSFFSVFLDSLLTVLIVFSFSLEFPDLIV